MGRRPRSSRPWKRNLSPCSRTLGNVSRRPTSESSAVDSPASDGQLFSSCAIAGTKRPWDEKRTSTMLGGLEGALGNFGCQDHAECPSPNFLSL